MSDVVLPPDQTVWWDDAATTAGALAILRLGVADVDAGRVADLVPVAGERINNWLDRAGPPPSPIPATWSQAIIDLTVAQYLAKQTPPMSVEDFTLASGYLLADPMQTIRPMIAASKERVGLA